MTRHRWSPPDRRENETIRTCVKCGLMKIGHREWEGMRPLYWTEYVDPDGRKATKLPVCTGAIGIPITENNQSVEQGVEHA